MTPPIDAVPWFAQGAVEYLDAILSAHEPAPRVLEFGAGGSSVWLASRCARLISIESSAAWADSVRDGLKLLGADHATVLLVEADDPADFDPAYRGVRDHSYRAYVTAGRQAVDAQLDGRVDLLLVDGRARVACVRDCAALVRPGGTLLLDNADRRRYAPAISFLASAGWQRMAQFTASFGRAPVTEFWVRPEGAR